MFTTENLSALTTPQLETLRVNTQSNNPFIRSEAILKISLCRFYGLHTNKIIVNSNPDLDFQTAFEAMFDIWASGNEYSDNAKKMLMDIRVANINFEPIIQGYLNILKNFKKRVKY